VYRSSVVCKEALTKLLDLLSLQSVFTSHLLLGAIMSVPQPQTRCKPNRVDLVDMKFRAFRLVSIGRESISLRTVPIPTLLKDFAVHDACSYSKCE
jgi:hypothetical protein